MIKKNNVILISLLISITFPVTALTIEAQESRMNHLNDLSYEIKETRLRVERAELQKKCQSNDGCLDMGAPIIDDKKPQEGVDAINAVKRAVANSRYANELSINAIINNKVVFKGIDGSYGPGDFLNPEIKIKSIKGSRVVLSITGSNNREITKVIAIDWIME